MTQFGRWQGALTAASIAFVLSPWLGACGGGSGDSKDGDPQGPAGSGGATLPNTGGNGSGGMATTTGSGGASGSGGKGVTGSGGVSGSGGGGTSGAPAGTGGATEATDSGMMPGGSGPFPPVTDLAGDGPYMGTTMAGVGPNSNYTVYLPTELAPNGAKNPIVVWMSGGGTSPDFYTLLPHLATHGFVVVASNSIPGIGDEVALGDELKAGITWTIDENNRADSMLFGKLDETKIASMGYSMGSLATFTIADDERLTTTVHISGGNMEPTRVMNLRQPAAFLCGIPVEDCADLTAADCDIAGYNCKVDFMNATTPVFYAYFNYGHLGILTDPYAALITSAATGWLRWKLMSDSTLASMFVGPDCTLCKDSADWTVEQKGL